jgi:site-specific recombinase XerD
MIYQLSRGGRNAIRIAARSRRPAPIARDPAQLPPRASPEEQGTYLSAGPTTVEEITAVMRAAGGGPEGVRLRGIIVVLWRAGLRISEALALNETDLDPARGSLIIRRGKCDKRREVGMDRWAWTHLTPWLEIREPLPVGRLFCIVRGPTRGGPCASAGIRAQLHHAAATAGVRRRFAPHQLRHAHAVEMSREGISLIVIPMPCSSRSGRRSGSFWAPPELSKPSTTRDLSAVNEKDPHRT